MEDIMDIFRKIEDFNTHLRDSNNDIFNKVHQILYGTAVLSVAASAATSAAATEGNMNNASPQQTKKRVKRLSSLNEDDEKLQIPGEGGATNRPKSRTRSSSRTGNSKLLAAVDNMTEEEAPTAMEVPIAKPVAAPRIILDTTTTLAAEAAEAITETAAAVAAAPNTTIDVSSVTATTTALAEHEFVRPQRMAKLKSEKNLKEPTLNKKMRRPTNEELVKIKLEHEQRVSQLHNLTTTASNASVRAQSTASSVGSDASVLLLPPLPAAAIIELVSDVEPDVVLPQAPPVIAKVTQNVDAAAEPTQERQLRIKIKREKISLQASASSEEKPDKPQESFSMEQMQAVPQPMKSLIKAEPLPANETAAHSISVNTTATASNNNTTTTTNNTTTTKKGGRKKKDAAAHRPIKVERFSDIEAAAQPSPISSRTRHSSLGRNTAAASNDAATITAPVNTTAKQPRAASVYEDAVDNLAGVTLAEQPHADTPPTRTSKVPKEVAAAVGVNVAVAAINETVTLSAACDATFTAPPLQTTFQVSGTGQTTFVMDPNATVTIAKQSTGDATFDVRSMQTPTSNEAAAAHDDQDLDQSMVTAREDTSNPHDDSLINESLEVQLPPPKAPVPMKVPTSAKAYKMPTRTNELFNPLVQSPVKKKVEAFETAAAEQAKRGRPKKKENLLSSSTTPQIGKLHGTAAMGRFLTPTQSSNITPNVMTKKVATSASKVMPFPKTMTPHASNSGGSASSKTSSGSTTSTIKSTLSRENSGDDFRRGLHQLAEERKKQREQKHLLAAQQREAKERERAERMAKMTKEREEKRLKKQVEAEQKKRALDEINRKLKQNEEAELLRLAQAAAKSKAIQEQERELLQQMKPPKAKQLVPLPPKCRTKYTFEMLHEDDSTDDEEKITYKRPAPPTWSRSNVRGPAIHMQQSWPTDIIDSFFSVQPMTPDLKLIFPNIDARHLKRNSSAFWSTPPRYSELPKY